MNNKWLLCISFSLGVAGITALLGAVLLLVASILAPPSMVQAGTAIVVFAAMAGAVGGWVIGNQLAASPRTSTNWIFSTVGILTLLIAGIVGLRFGAILLTDLNSKPPFRLSG